MPQFLSGPGIGLALPQNLYPTQLQNAPADASSNRLALNAGDSFVLPSGDWYVNPGMYSIFQFLDPITNTWTMGTAPGWNTMVHISSDGFNWRVANLLGCPVSAVVQNAGSAYVQGSTTISVTGGTSTWLPIVGGALSLISMVNNGAGYGVAPIVFVPPPPPAANNANGVGGIAANAYAVIANGTVSGITFTNQGAGYPVAPTPVIIPSPFDPNLVTGITQAVATFTITASGSITGALCTNNGAPLANPANITLTVNGAGSSGSLTAMVLQTVTAATVSGPGIGYGTGLSAIQTVGGGPIAGSITPSPEFLHLAFRPRPAIIAITPTNTSVSVGSAGVIYDGGLFLQAPTAVWISPSGGVAPTTIGTIAFTMGSVQDIVFIQPSP
jgi:hypothetical protein